MLAVATYKMKTLYLIKPSLKAVVVVLRHIDHKVKDGAFQQFLGTVWPSLSKLHHWRISQGVLNQVSRMLEMI